MKIWTVDAQDVNSISEDLLYETPRIEHFLLSDSVKFLVVATKGFGKTLLLRAKRLRLEEQQRGILLLPESSMVDKPLGFVPIFSRHDIGRLNRDDAFWEARRATLERIAIAVDRHRPA